MATKKDTPKRPSTVNVKTSGQAKEAQQPGLFEAAPLTLTRSEERLLTAATEIASTPPELGEDMAFTHAIFCQVGLPRSKVTGREFMRQSGAAWLNLQAGYLDEGSGPVLQPIPYGVTPRLALAYLSTFAVKNRTREIPVGDSASQFLKLMGQDSQGTRHKTLRTQMHALAACRLQMGYKGRTYNGQAIEQFDAWIADHDTGQRSLWPGQLVLSESFYNTLTESAVPLDLRALQALKGSALALDIYIWLAHRLHRIEGRPVILHWKSLREQFAQEYQGKNAEKDFRTKFLIGLQAVQAVYPEAKVKRVEGGLLLLASPPPIPYKF